MHLAAARAFVERLHYQWEHASSKTNSTRGASFGIKLGWSKTLTRASDCRVRTPRTTGKPWTCRVCALSLRNYSTPHKVANGRVAKSTRISSDDRATCCRVSSDAEPAAQGCPRTGRTIQDAFASAVQQPQRAVLAMTQRLST